MNSSPIVRLTGVSKSFSSIGGDAVDVLDSVDFEIAGGEKASLVGPSGCGKSTLLSLVAGLLRPDRGSVIVDGEPLEGLHERARARLRAERIGIALQSDNLIPFLSARENVELAMTFGGRRKRGQAVAMLDRFGVAHRAEHRPRHLSGGEAQRVALAVSLANEPALLLADEVVAQLDGDTAGLVVDEVLDGAFAVLYVTHDLALADRVPCRYRLSERRIETR